MSEPPALPHELELGLSETEHQALDLLDQLDCGALWIAAQSDQNDVLDDLEPSPRTRFEAALADAGEDLAAVEQAVTAAGGVLTRLIAEVAGPLVEAAQSLANSDARGDLVSSKLQEARRALNASPELSPAIAPAVETTGVILGLDRRSIAWALLVSLGERAHAAAPASLRACSTAIAERLQAARPGADPSVDPSADRPGVSKDLRVFRSAAVALAGPSIRARLLAADHPEHLAIAREIVAREREPLALIEAFDSARAALEQSRAPQQDQPEVTTDGPKRRFTWIHAVLALIILGLTLWHYVWR